MSPLVTATVLTCSTRTRMSVLPAYLLPRHRWCERVGRFSYDSRRSGIGRGRYVHVCSEYGDANHLGCHCAIGCDFCDHELAVWRDSGRILQDRPHGERCARCERCRVGFVARAPVRCRMLLCRPDRRRYRGEQRAFRFLGERLDADGRVYRGPRQSRRLPVRQGRVQDRFRQGEVVQEAEVEDSVRQENRQAVRVEQR